jgi:dihydrofolate reductase
MVFSKNGAIATTKRKGVHMGELTLFMHISLDGFAADVDGKMDWIHVDNEIFDSGSERIYATELAVYGRKTFQMMESYWPSAADQPNATKHDIEHSKWYMNVKKVVLSRTLKRENSSRMIIISDNLAEEINYIKKKTDKF